MAIESKVVSNLIQGVSQQAAQQRRDSQCEAQFDCVNSPKDGAWARHGADLIKVLPLPDMTTSWMYELFRGVDEHYLVTLLGGALRIYNLETGEQCSLTVLPGYVDYLGADASYPRQWFCAQTVDDYTFIASKERPPALKPDVEAARPKEAILFFRAGAYSARFTVSVYFGLAKYSYSYRTPDNSTTSNADYITTTQIAATFYRAFTGAVASTAPSEGVGSIWDGDTGGSGTGYASQLDATIALTSIGFSVEINGNLIRIWREDGQDFSIDTADSVGDSYLTAIKDNVRTLADLPKGGFAGFTVRVRGKSAEDNSADFYVRYVNKSASSGYWEECAKPGVKTTLDPQSMPHALINTGPNAFTIGPNTWSKRIAGDGLFSAKDPGFVGRQIRDMFYHKGRFGIMTEASADWSKARNPFTFFPDTVQAVLADAPIGAEPSAAGTIALLRRSVQNDENLYLWAQGVQFRVHSGSDPFRQDTVAADPAMNYEFAPDSTFPKVGTSIYFATEPDRFASIRNLQFQNGRPVGDVDVSDHVSEYIPAGVRFMSVSDAGKMLMVQTDGAYNTLYLYNFLTQDRQIVQSAWNAWRMPEGLILWCSIYRMHVYMALQRGDGVHLLKVPLRASATDPGGEYRTRLDLRVDETAVTGLSYDEATDTTTMVLPYIPAVGEIGRIRVVLRESNSRYARGRMFPYTSVMGATIKVRGNLVGAKFYAGLAISSERTESTFYLRGPQGVVPTDSLNVREFVVKHDRSAYYRIEVEQGANRTKKVYELHPAVAGTGDTGAGDPPQLVKGQLNAAVDCDAEEVRITMVNDSPFPSRWQTAEYRYEAVLRAKPSRVRSAE